MSLPPPSVKKLLYISEKLEKFNLSREMRLGDSAYTFFPPLETLRVSIESCGVHTQRKEEIE